MKHILASCLFLSLAACARVPEHDKVLMVDETALPIFLAFQSQYGLPIDDLTISFTEFQDGGIGNCRSGYNYTPEVTLSRKYWESHTYWDNRQTLFHELGHCILGLGHSQDRTIMYPIHLGLDEYNEYTYKRYENELFGR